MDVLMKRRKAMMALATPEPHDYSLDYLTFKITKAGTVGWMMGSSATAATISYKLNSGSWTSITPTTSGVTFNVSAGDTVLWKGTNSRYSGENSSTQNTSCRFMGTAEYDLCGNIMSLIGGDNYLQTTTYNSTTRVFPFLFYNTKVQSAKNLIFPNDVTDWCYYYMFYGCCTEAPVLPATTLATRCYGNMFSSSKIVVPPELPATTLTDSCYYSMFSGCSKMTTPPALPATTLASSCYSNMFQNCKFTQAPELPATTLEANCYQNMFYGCTNITTAPTLFATTLVSYCYYQMFRGCSSLNNIKCYAINSTNDALTNWVNGVASSGTFEKHTLATSWTTGVNGIPTDWTVNSANAIVNDGKAYGLLTVPSDGTYRIFYTSGGDNAGRFTAVTIDGTASGTGTRDVTLTAGQHIIAFTMKDNQLGMIFRGSNSYWTDIFIPSSITNIGDSSFQDMNFAFNLHIDKTKITYIGTNAFRKTQANFGDIYFPNLASTGNYPFYNYYRNAPVTNLGTLTTIGEYFFCECSIKNFDISATVTSLGTQCFKISAYDITYTFRSTTPPTFGSTAIWRTPVAIYVPADSVEAYKAASGWSSFANQIQAIQ